MPLAIALVALIALSLNPALAERVDNTIEHFFSSVTKGTVGTTADAVTNAWVKVAVIAGGLGVGWWLLEAGIAKKFFGQDVAAPPVAAIGVPAPPSFGGQSGFGFQGHGVNFSTGGTASSGGMSSSGGAVGTPGTPSADRAPRRSKRSRGFGDAA